QAGAAGIKLGTALIAPGRLTRAHALRHAARISIRLLGGAIIFLLIAAFIEAYWSSSNSLSVTTKVTVGAALWALVLLYLGYSGRGRHAPQ
ncbi:MAG: stage II sporulation protein M, partial [Pseudomonas sp.]